MSDETKKTPAHIRTFASDLDAERNKRKTDVRDDEVVINNNEVVVPEKTLTSDIAKELTRMDDKKPEPIVHKDPVPTHIVPPKAAQTKIPAFHELQKKINLLQDNQPVKKQENITVPTKTKSVELDEEEADKKVKPKAKHEFAYGGKIITDTKNDDFELVPSIITSIKKWFANYLVERKRKALPKYVLPETNRRKGVIQKATSKTGTIFTADNDTLKEKIRRRREVEHVIEEEEEDEPETTWSPFTETGYNLLEAPEVKVDTTSNVVVEFKKASPVVEKEINEEVIPEIKTVIATEVTPEPIVSSKETVLLVPEPTKVAEAPTPVSPVPEKRMMVIEKTVTSNQPKASLLERMRYIRSFVSRLSTNSLTIILLMSLFGLALFAISVKVITNEFFPAAEIFVEQINDTEKIISNSTLLEIKVEPDKSAEVAKQIISSLDESDKDLVEAVIITKANNELTPTEIFGMLSFKTIPNLPQSIVNVRFVEIDNSDPVILLKYVDGQTVRGGLLKWEKVMASNLSPFYPQISSASSTPSFKDGVIAGVDVRILQNDKDTNLVYGLTDNLVIITRDRETFAKILKSDFSK